MPEAMHLWSGLYLCHPVHALREHELGRGRQVSTLSLVGHMRRVRHLPDNSYLAHAAPIQSFKLKRRLLRAGIFKPRCGGSSLTVWQGSPIPLELDHIHGDNGDNRLENLRLLCPNCHALTPLQNKAPNQGLARYCSHPDVLLFHRI